MTVTPTQSDVDSFKRKLSDWISLDDCEGLVTDYVRNHGDFARGLRGGKLWRESFDAIRFARAANAESLRIGADPPDFEFRVAGKCIQVELVVARDVDDMTSKEFHQAANFIGPAQTVFESLDEVALQESWKSLPNRIAQQVKAKSEKKYPTSLVLAVAASSFWWANDGETMESAILKSCEPYSRVFSDIWILAGDHFISLKSAHLIN